jgi:hypothetical protein
VPITVDMNGWMVMESVYPRCVPGGFRRRNNHPIGPALVQATGTVWDSMGKLSRSIKKCRKLRGLVHLPMESTMLAVVMPEQIRNAERLQLPR